MSSWPSPSPPFFLPLSLSDLSAGAALVELDDE